MRPASVLNIRLSQGGNRCDFCGCQYVAKLFPCRNFKWEERPIFTVPVGRWAACDTCSGLVERDDWAALSVRVMRGVRKRKGISIQAAAGIRRELRAMHKELRLHILIKGALGVRQAHYTKVQAIENLC